MIILSINLESYNLFRCLCIFWCNKSIDLIETANYYFDNLMFLRVSRKNILSRGLQI